MVGFPLWMGAGFYFTDVVPTENVPGLWLYGHFVFLPQPFGALPLTGLSFDVTIPPGLDGLKLLVQAVGINASTTLGYATSDAHEFWLIP